MTNGARSLPVPFDDFTQPMPIEHSVGGEIVPQRPLDGYINATRLCKQAGKQFGGYQRLSQTQECPFLTWFRS